MTCADLREALVEIAFVLEVEARQIEEEEKSEIHKFEEKYYEEFNGKLSNEIQSQ